jgi:hypothetical protein
VVGTGCAAGAAWDVGGGSDQDARKGGSCENQLALTDDSSHRFSRTAVLTEKKFSAERPERKNFHEIPPTHLVSLLRAGNCVVSVNPLLNRHQGKKVSGSA